MAFKERTIRQPPDKQEGGSDEHQDPYAEDLFQTVRNVQWSSGAIFGGGDVSCYLLGSSNGRSASNCGADLLTPGGGVASSGGGGNAASGVRLIVVAGEENVDSGDGGLFSSDRDYITTFSSHDYAATEQTENGTSWSGEKVSGEDTSCDDAWIDKASGIITVTYDDGEATYYAGANEHDFGQHHGNSPSDMRYATGTYCMGAGGVIIRIVEDGTQYEVDVGMGSIVGVCNWNSGWGAAGDHTAWFSQDDGLTWDASGASMPYSMVAMSAAPKFVGSS